MDKIKIIITGKNSYIGTAVKEWLKNYEKYDVDTVDVKNNNWKMINFSKYDCVFHVAGLAHSNPSENQKELYYAVNRDLCIEIAKYAKLSGVKQFIFMSSAIVYTDSEKKNGKITINTIPFSRNFYGDSKIQAENGLKQISDDNFRVVILRPPMIYGKNSKGNYPKLAKLAKFTPFFPDFENKRSMLHIDNLSEFVRLCIDNKSSGIFFPQNKEYVSINQLVRTISSICGHNILFIKLFNPIINLLINKTIINKIFGDFYYDYSMSNEFNGSYWINTFEESIIKTEIY